MRICDLTMAYSETSGGIRTYLEQKRRVLLEQTEHEHVLVVPGEANRIRREGRATTHEIKSPPTGYGSYRLLWRPDEIARVLDEVRPDVVELGTFFVSPWPALHERDRRRARGERCAVVGYFHTDLADAYVQSPVDELVANWVEGVSEGIAGLGEKLAELLGAGAERYFGHLFGRCDAMLAASETQRARLEAYGIDDAHVVPMGVDLDRFHPERRSNEVRARYGADGSTCLLVYAGRLDREKRVQTVVEAFELLEQRGLPVRLVMAGDGPARERLAEHAAGRSGLHVPGYVGDPEELAVLLASGDVYVTAGPHETFGLSVIEAQAAGLPVVGVSSGALVDRVVEGTGHLGPVDDAEAMAENVQRAWEQRAELGAAARRHVETHFAWEASIGRLLEVYQRVIEQV